MRRVKDHLRTCFLVALALLVARPGLAGHSAESLFLNFGILDVSVSPGGDWAIAHAVSGELNGLLAQRLGSRQVSSVLATGEPIRGVHWIGKETVLVTFWTGWTLAGRIHDEGGTVELTQYKVPAPGWLVDPLPLVEDTVIWEFEYSDENSVHRVQLSDLVDYRKEGRLRRGSVVLGETLASVPGSAHRWVVDRDGNPRVARTWKEGTHKILARPADSTRFREIYRFEDSEEKKAIYPMGLSVNGESLIVLAYGDSDTRGLYDFDLESGKLGSKLFDRDDVDITDALFDPIHGDLIAAVFEDGGERRLHYLDSEASPKLSALRRELSSESLDIVSRSADRNVYILRASGPTNPGTYFLRDESTGSMVPIAKVADELREDDLVDVETLNVVSKDGTQVEAFLTLPRLKGEGSAPLVVYPHGGPIGVRDNKEYDPLVQYLASWGFAILQVNYRGSSGYGRGFEDAGKKEWAQGIEDDIDAAVESAMALSEIDAARLCIVGGSYGGFSALASIVRHEARYRCAVTINGVTDIPLSFETSDFADDERTLERFAEVVGDVETERDRLIESSPVYHVQRMKTPVYVIYGTDDRRVDPDHSHRLLLMLETLGKEHESLEIQGAGHSPTTREWIVLARALRRYLTKHLFPSQAFELDPDAGAAPRHFRLPRVQD